MLIFKLIQLGGLVTLLKNKYLYYLPTVILGLLALYFKSPIFVFILVAVALGTIYLLEQDDSDSEIEVDSEITVIDNETGIRSNSAEVQVSQIVNTIPSPLVFFDSQGNIKITNIYFDQIVKHQADNVYDNTIDYTIRNVLIEASINQNQFIRRINFNGLDYQVHAIPTINDNVYSGSMLVFQDVTQIVESENMQKRFISDASHELRTPIASIMGMIEIINRPDFNDENAQKEFLQQIDKEARTLDHIVKDLLLQSKMRENKLYLDKVIFNIKDLFESIIYDLRKELEKANITVNLDCLSNINIYADQFRLTQVFINLFNNSINYATNGVITVSCEVEDSIVTIKLSDNGKGISDDILPHIFDRFYRGESDRGRQVGGGSGLGLAISKSIVEAHDGSIHVDSKINEGTTFTIKLTQS